MRESRTTINTRKTKAGKRALGCNFWGGKVKNGRPRNLELKKRWQIKKGWLVACVGQGGGAGGVVLGEAWWRPNLAMWAS